MIVHSVASNSQAPTAAASPGAPCVPRDASSSLTAADRLPQGIGRTWLIALVATAIVLAAVEVACRQRGMQPAISDDQNLWASVRDGMRRDDPAQIALVGTSRMRLDFDTREFSRDMGGAPVAQLAIEGSEGLLMFEELSRDDHFRGLLVFDVVPWSVFADMNEHDRTSTDYLAYRAHRPWIAPIDARLRNAVQMTFAFEQITYRRLMKDLRSRRWPRPLPTTMDSDRAIRADWSRASRQELNQPMQYLMEPLSYARPPQVRENLAQLELLIRRIESRGGRVALLVLPSTGPLGDAERAACPRERYWDVLAATTSAVTLNWMDDPRLRKFQCPDGSHLDMRDQAEFTRIVVEDLREKLQTR